MAKTTRNAGERKAVIRTFGAHMSIAGGCDRAVLAARTVGFETVQLFTKNNNQWNAPALDGRACHGVSTRHSTETGITDPVAHTSYLINLASPDDISLGEIDRRDGTSRSSAARSLGIPDLVVHPGAHMGAGEKKGAGADCQGPRQGPPAARRGMGVMIDLETTAGQGTNLGYRFEHLRDILDRVERPGPPGGLRGYLPYFRGRLFPGDARRSTMKRSSSSTGPSGLAGCACGT